MCDLEDDSPVLESDGSTLNSSNKHEINQSEASTLESEEEEEQIIPQIQEVEEKVNTQVKAPIKKQVEEKEAKEKGKRKKKIYQPVTSEQFFKSRSKDPNLFTFTADGNLQVPEVDGKPSTVIELPFYTRMTFEEEERFEEERRVEIEENEKEFDETLRLLREAIQEWRDTGAISRVGEYQRKLKEIDAKRFTLRSPIHYVEDVKSISINQIDFSNRYEKRKVPYELHMLKLRKFPVQVEYKATNENPFAQKEEEEEEEEKKLDVELNLGEGEQEKQKEEFTFFGDSVQANGFLSPDSMFRFRYKTTEYNSPIQAYHAERLTRLGKPAIRMLLLKQTTPRGIRAAAQKVVGDLEDAREVWIDILKEYVKYNSQIKEQLAETEGTTLAYADLDTSFGIGMTMDNPEKEERSNWTGKNIVGEAWMAVRNSLEDLEDAPTEGGAPLEVAASPEDVKRRSGVLMNMYKVKKGVTFS